MNFTPCVRCNGMGYFPEYKKIENGICFRCRGARYEELIESKMFDLENYLDELEKYKQSEDYRHRDYYDIEYVYQGDVISKSQKRKATPYIAAYIIKCFLPDNIEISRKYSQYEDNEFYFRVEITIK